MKEIKVLILDWRVGHTRMLMPGLQRTQDNEGGKGNVKLRMNQLRRVKQAWKDSAPI